LRHWNELDVTALDQANQRLKDFKLIILMIMAINHPQATEPFAAPYGRGLFQVTCGSLL